MVIKDPLVWHCFCFGWNLSSCSWLRELTACLPSICSLAKPKCLETFRLLAVMLGQKVNREEAKFERPLAMFKGSRCVAENSKGEGPL